jgi:WD40 repeat protein
MAREPERRFSSGAELKEELERFLRGEPIRSRLAGPVERTVRWCRKYPASSSLGGAVAILLVTLLAVTIVSARRLAQRLYVAEVSTARALRASGSPGRRFESLAAIGRAVKTAPTESDRSALRDEAIAALALADIREVLRHPEPLTQSSSPVFDRELERYAILDVGLDQIAIRRVRDGTEIRRVESGAQTKGIFSFSPDGSFLGTRSSVGDRLRLRVVRLTDGSVALERETGPVGTDMRFLPGGRILMGEADGSISIVVIESGGVERTLRPRAAAESFRLSPDSKRILVQLSSASALDVIDLDDETKRITIALTAAWFGADWSPDGRLIAVPAEGRIDLWDARTGDFFQSLEGHLGRVTGAVFSADGLLASTSWDGTLRFWDSWSGDPLLTTAAPMQGFSFSRDGRRLATALGDVTVFEVERGNARRVLRSPAAPKAVGGIGTATHAAGRVLATGWSLWDIEEGRELLSLHDGWNPSQVRFLRGGRSVWLDRGSGMVEQAVDLSTQPEEEVFVLGPAKRLADVPAGLTAFDFDSSGRLAVWVEQGSQVVLYDRVERKKEILGQHPGADNVSVTSDGRWAVTGTYNRGKGLKIWDLGRLALARELEATRWMHGAFSPSGRWLATATGNAYAIHEVGTWSLQRSFSRDADNSLPGPCAWSPDGKFLAITLAQGAVTMVDATTGAVAARLSSPQPRGILSLEVTPEGESLIAGCANGAVEVWDLRVIAAGLETIGLELESGLVPLVARRPARPLRVELAEDGAMASGAWNEAIRVWERELELSPSSALARNNLAWALVTGPEESRDPPRALALAEAAVRESGGNAAYLNTLGAACYRMGDYKQAIDVLLRGANAGSGVTAWDGFFIAMALKRLGLDSLASYHYDSAVEWIERHVELYRSAARELSALRSEAAGVLGRSGPAGEPAPPAGGTAGPKG